jgi:hypothetical protein
VLYLSLNNRHDHRSGDHKHQNGSFHCSSFLSM